LLTDDIQIDYVALGALIYHQSAKAFRPRIEEVAMEHLAKHVAELALRLTALPADGLRQDMQTLDSIEQLASQILKEVSSVRAARSCTLGETRGMWRAMQPVPRQ
jgi:hypothetical protein